MVPLSRFGKEVGPPTAKHTLGLKVMARLLAPEASVLIDQHHDAGSDAQVARLIYIALVKRAKQTAAHGQPECDAEDEHLNI